MDPTLALDLASDRNAPKSPPHPIFLLPIFTYTINPIRPHLNLDFHSSPEPATSRLALLGNVPKSATSDVLKQSLKQSGSVKGILVRFQPIHGFVDIAFYDSRDAAHARVCIPQISIHGVTLSARLLSPVISIKVRLPVCRNSSTLERAIHLSFCFPASRLYPVRMPAWTSVRPLYHFHRGWHLEREPAARLSCVLWPPSIIQSFQWCTFFPGHSFLVPDRLITCRLSVILQSIPTLGVPRCSSVMPMGCALGLAPALNLSPQGTH